MGNKIITAIVLDGFHAGHVVRTSGYLPVLRLLKPKVIKVDYCCGGDEFGPEPVEEVEYKATFHGTDRKVVLYSEKGESEVLLSLFSWENSFKPWSYGTTLKMGYHHEPIIRKDDDTQMTEYERGYEKGIVDGRVIQAKEFSQEKK